MAKRDNGGNRTRTAAAKSATETMTGDAMERRILDFAEQLGRIAGTVQAKTEGWMDKDALQKQIAGVRDSAAELLQQLTSSVTGGKTTGATPNSAASRAARNKGRSGGIVDAPGKKHRKPMPKDPRAVAADARVSSMRSTKASMKTMKQRGRG